LVLGRSLRTGVFVIIRRSGLSAEVYISSLGTGTRGIGIWV
jgi:hypothetical protein